MNIRDIVIKIGIIFLLASGIAYAGFKILQMIKFNTVVSLTVAKGPFKGANFKLMDYQVSMNDLQYQQNFWDSPLGQSIFNQLSSTLQTVVRAGSHYVNIEFDMNFLGLWHKHYDIHDAVRSSK